MNRFSLSLLVLAATIGATSLGSAHALHPEIISLTGTWRFALDRDDQGVSNKWFERDLSGKVILPGNLPAQGIGDNVSLDTKWVGGIQDPDWYKKPIYAPYAKPDNLKFPFWLQPDKYYAGAAWYQRDFELPATWQGKRVVLTLERPHWETSVWVDDIKVGSNRSLFTPHAYGLGTSLAPGRHRLTIRVDNSMVVDVGENSHGVSDHTQGNWNGIVGSITLEATSPVWIEDLQVYPSLEKKSVALRGRIGNATGRSGSGKLSLRVDEAAEPGAPDRAPLVSVPVSWEAEGGEFQCEISAPAAKPWDEFNPVVFNLSAQLQPFDEWKTVRFGFREIGTEGTQFVLNDRKVFFRGTLECCIFPLTGHPPTDTASWTRILRTAKAHGLNMFRFHSYCPPEAAFNAADAEGFYFQVETCWPNQSTTLGDGKPVDQWVYAETDRILKAYGNHPSFLLMAHGNEPGGGRAKAYLAKYVTHYRAQDSRRLWTSASGWPQLAENQFHVTPDPRIQAWGQGLKSRINARPPETTTDYRDYIRTREVPVISHEIGQWCVYPNFDEIPKYKGYLKPKNFEIFRDTLAAHHMGDLARQFLLASGKLQTLCYKEDIESALRTPGMGGFQLLDLHDFPGQGTALIGVLDPFWEPKGYVTAEHFSRFCGSTVPLARMAKRVFTTNEKFEASLAAAHFGSAPWDNVLVTWRLVDTAGELFQSGRLEPLSFPLGSGIPLGRLSVDLSSARAPAQYRLIVKLSDASLDGLGSRDKAKQFENDWDIWVYPEKVETEVPANVAVVNDLDAATEGLLQQGRSVLWLLPPDRVRGDTNGKVGLGFSSIFWNTAWTHRQPPHTLGILCDPRHPALAQFPTEDHSNWQWWYLVSQAGAMILDDLPSELRPTVQVIDDWVTNRKLGLIFEAGVGQGNLVACSIDLNKDMENNPVARQMLHSLLAYMGSSEFKPAVRLTVAQLRALATE